MKAGMITQTKSVAVPTTYPVSTCVLGSKKRDLPPPKTLISCVWANFGVQDPDKSGCHTFFIGMHCKPMTKSVASATTVKIAIVVHMMNRRRRWVPLVRRRTKAQTEHLTRYVPMPLCISTKVVYIVIGPTSDTTNGKCLPNPCLTCKVFIIEP